ncbi:MAG: MMPL family transporter [Alphaproteobacteria bacterium]|nr:MMPL family transporter [Alphaproteobacteria bacterium]
MPIARLLGALVDGCRRRAPAVVLLALALAVAVGGWTAGRIGIDADPRKLIAEDLPWRRLEIRFEQEFPQRSDLLLIVLDGPTADLAEDAATRLAAALAADTARFRRVARPDGGDFFRRNGLLFLPTDALAATLERTIAAQPLIGTLAADPSMRGILQAIGLVLTPGQVEAADLDRMAGAFERLARTAEAAARGPAPPLDWRGLLTGEEHAEYRRRLVLAQPVLDYSGLAAGGAATAAARAAAAALGLVPEAGYRVRLTGPVALTDEEFASIAHGAQWTMTGTVMAVLLILFLALRSWRLILAIAVTLAVGLVLSGGFAIWAVGRLNPISMAFAVLFIGIAVDFGIQFSVRYRDERHRTDDLATALAAAGAGVGGALTLAAVTTAIGFYAFVPTAYRGVSELGIISGTSMLIAVLLNLTLLPALIALLRPRAEPEPIGWTALAPLDRWLVRRRRPVLAVAAVVALAGAVSLAFLRFDFEPLNLKDPSAESVVALRELATRLDTTPYVIDVMAPSLAAAQALAPRIAALPEVARTVTLASFVPADQDAKLAAIADAAFLLGPTLSPPAVAPPPSAAARTAAVTAAVDRLRRAAGTGEGPGAHAAAGLARALAILDGAGIERLAHSWEAGLPATLGLLRDGLEAGPVTRDSLPQNLQRDWVAADGTARIAVFPKGDTGDPAVLRRFVGAVRALAPDATGMPVSIQDSAATISGAFRTALLWALGAIGAVLLVVLRRPGDVALVLAPLFLAALAAAIVSVAFDLPLNYANVIALPLMLGIGVALDIYLVVRWRAGLAGPLASSTTRAVAFSAATTAAAFGSLSLSPHAGTAAMGLLLLVTLGLTVAATLLFLPALMGPPGGRR